MKFYFDYIQHENLYFKDLNDLHDFYSKQLQKFTLPVYFKKIRTKFHKDINLNFLNLFVEVYEHKNEKIIEPKQIKEFGIEINNKISPNELKELLTNNKEYYDTYLLLEKIYQDYQDYNNLLKECRKEFHKFNDEFEKYYPQKKMTYRNKKQ